MVVPKGVEPSLHSLKTSCPYSVRRQHHKKLARFLRVELSFPRLQRRPMTPQIQTGLKLVSRVGFSPVVLANRPLFQATLISPVVWELPL